MLTKKDIGRFVRITFYDHALVDDKDVVMPCRALGEVVKVGPKSIAIRYWECTDKALEHNDEYVSIIKSTITKVEFMGFLQ